MSITSRLCARLLVGLLCLAGFPAPSPAQERIGGHFGVVIPLSTRANNVTTTVADGNNAQPILRSPWHGVWARRSYLEFTSTWRRWNFDAAGSFVGGNEFRMDISVDRGIETFTGSVEILTFDRAGTVTASRLGTFRATRINVRRPGL